jgi:Type II secretion system (T2SS), protein M
MTLRDRLMFMGITLLAVLGVVWYLGVAPEREKASKVSAEVRSARQQLASAEAQANEALSAQARYATAYTSLVTLGQAVPASAETPALIYMLNKATHKHDIQFSSITNGTSSTSSGSATSSAGSSASLATAAQSAGLTQQPFTFVFTGNFVDLSKLLGQLESFTVLTSSGPLQVSGRLLTIDSVTLAPNTSEAASTSNKSKSGELTGTITATAYVLPAGSSELGGATASSPAGGQSGSAGSSSGSSVTPALVKATTP